MKKTKRPKISIEQYTENGRQTGHFAVWIEGRNVSVADIDIPPMLDIPATLRLIAQAVRREAERIERETAPRENEAKTERHWPRFGCDWR